MTLQGQLYSSECREFRPVYDIITMLYCARRHALLYYTHTHTAVLLCLVEAPAAE